MKRSLKRIIYTIRFAVSLICIGFITSCNNDVIPQKTESSQQENITTDTKASETNKVVIGESAIVDVKGKNVKQYKYSNDSLVQTLNVEWVKENTINFDLYVENSNTKCQVQVSGMANAHNANADPEIDEDDNGDSYPSIEYMSQNSDCQIAIRIAMNSKDKAFVEIIDCPQTRQNDCPLESIGTLRIQK